MVSSKPSGRRAMPLLLTTVLLLSVNVMAQVANTNLPGLDQVTGATSAATSASAPATSNGQTSATSDVQTTNTPASATTGTSAASSATGTPYPSLNGVGIPPLIVPDTSGAPYMQKSTLPEGTVFICVGAALGFLGLCVLAWRGIVAWSLRRSVKRAASTTYAGDAKSMFGLGSAPAYTSMYAASSNMSLDHLKAADTAYAGAGSHSRDASTQRTGRREKHTSRRDQATASSLFFSPTANNAASQNNRSSYLPAGYYASGSAAPNGGASLAQFGGPQSAGYGRVNSTEASRSRPGSSHMRPGSSGHQARGSYVGTDRRSRLAQTDNASGPPTRAPSAYLEDLFSEHGYGPRERF